MAPSLTHHNRAPQSRVRIEVREYSSSVLTATRELIRNCQRCGRELAPSALVCRYCHALVHSEQLERIATEAKSLEAAGNLQQGREHWLAALPLLPPESKQAQWILDHAGRPAAGAISAEPSLPTLNSYDRIASRSGMIRLGTILSFLAFVALYSRGAGAKFGIGFAVLILIHEMGHYIDIRRRGLPADMPVFLPGIGAYVRWRAMGVSMETRAAISLAGPLAGLLAAVSCGAIWWQTHEQYWLVLARVGAALNLLNLTPVWSLDGGQAALALSKGERITLLIATLGLWIALRENVLLVVAAGAVYRGLFASDLPVQPSRPITAYFIGVVLGLSVILRILPGSGFSLP
jgi:Zn-dependent protease